MGDPLQQGASFGPGDFPQNPTQLVTLRVPQTPSVFSVTLTPDGTQLLFTVGYNLLTNGHYYTVNTFNIYFVPMSAVSQVGVSSLFTSFLTWHNAVLVHTITATLNGGPVTFTDSRFVSTDGFFWATAISSYGQESDPTAPYRAPAAGDLINTAIPPNAVSVSISKTSAVVEGATYSLVKAQAVVPSDNEGVISVIMTNNGSGYTSPPTVTFSGGLGPGGVAATGSAVLNNLTLQIVGIQIATSGSGYTTPPFVVLTGGGGFNASATAFLGTSTAFDGFQLYLTNYKGGTQVEGPFVNASGQNPGSTVTGQFYLLPDAPHVTTFTFVSVSRAGVRSLSGAPTATLTV